jgi:hypothetical protein
VSLPGIHVSARRDPRIDNCKLLIDSFPTATGSDEKNLESLIADRAKFEGVLVANHNAMLSPNGLNAGLIDADTKKTQQDIINLNDRISTVQSNIDRKHADLMKVCANH